MTEPSTGPAPDLVPVLPSDAELRSIMGEAHTVAVVGLSSKQHRESYEVAQHLQRKGYRIIPVNPKETQVLGERAYASLLDVPVEVDVVDVFRNAADTPPIAADAVAIGAKVLWLQDGILNPEAQAIAEAGGLSVIMGVCMRRTYDRLEEAS